MLLFHFPRWKFMRALTASCDCFRLARNAVVTCLVLGSALVDAQQIPFGFLMQPPQVELTAPHVDLISGATAARLEQARQLAAARSWDEAVDIYRELVAEKSDRVVALDSHQYLSLRNYCHLQIARFPAEGLAAYRR